MTDFKINGRSVDSQDIENILQKLANNPNLTEYHNGDSDFTSVELGRILDQHQPSFDNLSREDLFVLENKNILTISESCDLIRHFAFSQPVQNKFQAVPEFALPHIIAESYDDQLPARFNGHYIQDYVDRQTRYDFPRTMPSFRMGTKRMELLVNDIENGSVPEVSPESFSNNRDLKSYERSIVSVEQNLYSGFTAHLFRESSVYSENGSLLERTYVKSKMPVSNLDVDINTLPEVNLDDVTLQFHVKYEYDDFGNLLRAQCDADNNGVFETEFVFAYDEEDRLISRELIERDEEGDASVFQESWIYGANGYLQSHVIDRGHDNKIDETISYTWGENGCLERLESSVATLIGIDKKFAKRMACEPFEMLTQTNEVQSEDSDDELPKVTRYDVEDIDDFGRVIKQVKHKGQLKDKIINTYYGETDRIKEKQYENYINDELISRSQVFFSEDGLSSKSVDFTNYNGDRSLSKTVVHKEYY